MPSSCMSAVRALALATVVVFGALALPASAAKLTIGLGTDVTAIDPHYHNVTPNDNVAALTEDALATVDDVKREVLLLQRAAELAIGDTGIVPLHFPVNLWGTRDGIAYTPRTDENTLAWKFHPGAKRQ